MRKLILLLTVLPLAAIAQYNPPTNVSSPVVGPSQTVAVNSYYNAFPGLTWYQGQYLLLFRQATAHTGSAKGVILEYTSPDGMTWTNQGTVISDPTYDIAEAQPAVLANGELIVSYAVITVGSANIGCRTTIWNGSTWSTPAVAPTPAGWLVPPDCSAPVTQLLNGDLILPIYGALSLGNDASAVVRSTDGGATWIYRGTIADGHVLGYGAGEPNVIQLTKGALNSGNLYALFRDETSPYNIMQATSSDEGATWTATPTIAFPGMGSPHLTQVTNGAIVCTTRSTNAQQAMQQVSTDAATWLTEEILIDSDPALLYATTGSGMMYGAATEFSPGTLGVAYSVQISSSVANMYFKTVKQGGELPKLTTINPVAINVLGGNVTAYGGAFVGSLQGSVGPVNAYVPNNGAFTNVWVGLDGATGNAPLHTRAASTISSSTDAILTSFDRTNYGTGCILLAWQADPTNYTRQQVCPDGSMTNIVYNNGSYHYPIIWNANGVQVRGISATGASPTPTGCGTIGGTAGGMTAGTFTSGATSCTPVIPLPTVATGYACTISDRSLGTGVSYMNISSTTASATFPTITTTSGHTMLWECMGY